MFFRRFFSSFIFSFLFLILFFSCSDISETKASLVVSFPSSARAASVQERIAGYYVYLWRADIPEDEQNEENCPYQVAKPGESVFFDELDEGEYLVGVEAFDKDEWIIAGGEAKAKVVAGETANVSILMKSVSDESEETIKWDYSVVSALEQKTTVDGITISTTATKSGGNFYNGTLTFSIDGGRKFTKIEMLSTATTLSGTSVTVESASFYSTQDNEECDGSKITWTGNASEVSMTGYAYAVEYILFTID